MKTEIPTIFLASILITLFTAASALADATLTLEPSSEQINLGDEFTLDVQVSDIADLFGVSFEIQYDENILDYVEVSAGDFLGADVLLFDMEGENMVSVAVTMKAGANTATGSGIIATLTFIAKAKGEPQMSIRIDTLSLVTDDGASIPATPEDESITVIDPNEKAPVLSIELSKDEIPIGEQFPVEIKITDVSQLFGISFELQFDPTVLKAISAVPGDFLGDDTIDIAVPGDGNISVGVSRKAGVKGVDGLGIIAIITLETIAQGDSEIIFNSETITLNDSDGNPVEGANSLETNEANIYVQPPSLVPARKLVKTWGAIKRL